ncbi:MAG: hypothetical protein WCA89_00635, partial [Terracidiphilus sp.]
MIHLLKRMERDVLDTAFDAKPYSALDKPIHLNVYDSAPAVVLVHLNARRTSWQCWNQGYLYI